MFARIANAAKCLQVPVYSKNAYLFSTSKSLKSKPNWPVLDFEDQTSKACKASLDERVEDPRVSTNAAVANSEATRRNMSAFSKYEQKIETEVKRNLNKMSPIVDNRAEEKVSVTETNFEALDPRSGKVQEKNAIATKKPKG